MQRRYWTLKILGLVCLGCLCSWAQAALPPTQTVASTPSLAPMLERTMPAVVNLSIQLDPAQLAEEARRGPVPPAPPLPGPPPPDNPLLRRVDSIGSGVIVDGRSGVILTNAHVVRGAKAVVVNLSDGRRYKARILGVDVLTDLAVLKIQADRLVQIPLSDSSRVKVGDYVVAMGNPFGLSQTVTSGIVSALGRGNFGLAGPQDYESFIQTDASINPGNSGGALVNLKGELIGINTAIFSTGGGSVGIGFAIPSNMAKSVMQQILAHGQMQRGMLGIMVQNLNPEIASALGREKLHGALITQVTPGSPAEQAGLRPGDIIEALNDSPIPNALEARNAIGLLPRGSEIHLKILRDRKVLSLSLRSVDAMQVASLREKNMGFLFGLSFENYDFESAHQGHVQGAMVVQILENSPGWHAGLMPGDIILSANMVKTPNVAALHQAVLSHPSDHLLLHLRRGEGSLFIAMKRGVSAPKP